MTDVVITSAARTAIGSYGKGLSSVPPSDLGATAARAAVERAGIAPGDVEHVVFGNVIHTEPADAYMARVVGIKAGIPKETPAYTVNRLCGTGVQSIVSATQAIQTGEARTALAGGAESMSRGPYWLPERAMGRQDGRDRGRGPGDGGADRSLRVDSDGRDRREPGRRGSISRERQDAFAVRSHQRAAAARAEGRFDEQIVPVPITVRRGTIDVHSRRAHPRGRDGGVDGQAQARVRARGQRHRRQRLGDERRRRGGGADERRARRRARSAGASTDSRLRELRGRALDHGHRAGSGGAQGARARPAARWTRST